MRVTMSLYSTCLVLIAYSILHSYLVERDNFDPHTWGSYFSEIVHLFEAADRQYGVANQSYAQ